MAYDTMASNKDDCRMSLQWAHTEDNVQYSYSVSLKSGRKQVEELLNWLEETVYLPIDGN